MVKSDVLLLINDPVLYLVHDVLWIGEASCQQNPVDKQETLARKRCKPQVETYTFRYKFFVASPARSFLQFIKNWADHFLILKPQLLVDDLYVPNRVNVSLHVNDVLVVERAFDKQTSQNDFTTPQESTIF